MRIIIVILSSIFFYSCESKIELQQPENISARVYNTNKYHIGHGLYEHKVMYTYTIHQVRYYGEFIAKDYTKSHSSGYHIADIINIKYDSLNPKKNIFISFNGSLTKMKPIKLD